MDEHQWVKCPVCGNKTRLMIRPDTEIKHLPLYCPKRSTETLIDDVYLWLQENSYKFGFIFRYPGNKTEITGTAEEVWHYRYVGVEAATEIHERGICQEEYLEYLDSQN